MKQLKYNFDHYHQIYDYHHVALLLTPPHTGVSLRVAICLTLTVCTQKVAIISQ